MAVGSQGGGHFLFSFTLSMQVHSLTPAHTGLLLLQILSLFRQKSPLSILQNSRRGECLYHRCLRSRPTSPTLQHLEELDDPFPNCPFNGQPCSIYGRELRKTISKSPEQLFFCSDDPVNLQPPWAWLPDPELAARRVVGSSRGKQSCRDAVLLPEVCSFC